MQTRRGELALIILKALLRTLLNLISCNTTKYTLFILVVTRFIPTSYFLFYPFYSYVMQYQVVPFTANIANNGSAADAAAQLEQLIQQFAAHGWHYVRLERVYTEVAGHSGCFGIGATPARHTSITMVVFQRP